MDCHPPGSSVMEFFHPRILGAAISSSRGSSWLRDRTHVSCVSCLAGELFTTRLHFRRRQWHPTPVLLPGKSHGRRSLVGCSRWGSDMTKQLHFHFSLSCLGEGNGNPLQCSCLENPGDGGAWWAAVYGVAQSRTWLKRLSSNSSSSAIWKNLQIKHTSIEKQIKVVIKKNLSYQSTGYHGR